MSSDYGVKGRWSIRKGIRQILVFIGLDEEKNILVREEV